MIQTVWDSDSVPESIFFEKVNFEKLFNSYHSRGDFCHLLITFANSLYPDQAQQNVGPDLDPNNLTVWWYSWIFLWKNQQMTTYHCIQRVKGSKRSLEISADLSPVSNATYCSFGFNSFFHTFLSSADFFKINFFENSSRNTIRVSSSLDPDQARHFCLVLSGSKLFANVISRWQKSPLVWYELRSFSG